VESHVNSYQTAQSFMEHPPATVKVIEISPDQPLKSRLLGSNPEALRHDYRIGQACGRAFLEHYAWRLRCVSNPAASEFDA
jgi:predicted patatin/cPLA2 family phospholipase